MLKRFWLWLGRLLGKLVLFVLVVGVIGWLAGLLRLEVLRPGAQRRSHPRR